MTADPMVPDEAIQKARWVLDGQGWLVSTPAMHAALAAAMPALTAAARAEVAASVLPLADRWENIADTTPERIIAARALRAAVSDDGIDAHNQQMRAEALAPLIALLDQNWGGTPAVVILDELTDLIRAEAAGDQHQKGGAS